MVIKNIDWDICNGCKICSDICPEDVIHYNDAERKAYIAYSDDCVACLLCEAFCPVDCITVDLKRGRPLPSPY